MKSTRGKKIGIILAVLLVVVIAALLIIPKFIDLNRYNGLITSELEKAMGGRVTLGHLNWGITNGVWLEADGFTVKGATAFPGEVDLSRIYAKVSVLPLLSKKIVVDELLLDNPVVELTLLPSPAGEKKTPRKVPQKVPPTGGDAPAATDKQTSAGSPLPVEILIEELKIKKGRIRLEESLTLPGEKVVYNLADVLVEATNLAPGEVIGFQFAFRDEAKPGFGTFRGQGSFTGLTEALTLESPEVKLQGTLSDLQLDRIKPYLKNESLAQRLGGRVSLVLNYTTDLGQNLSAEGQIDLTNFTYTDPSMWEKSLPGAETKLVYQIKLEPDEIKIEKLNLHRGNISVRAEGLLQDWQKEPIIKEAVFSSDLPLVELISLVPWNKLGKERDIIRQALAGGGKVTIEKMVLPELTLTKLPDDAKILLSKIDGSISLSHISVGPSPELPKLEDIRGTFRLEKGVVIASNLEARMGPLTFPVLEIRATDLAGKPKVWAAAKGPLRLLGTQSADVEKLLHRYGLKSLSGSAEVDLRAHYDQAKPKEWDASGSLVLAGVRAVSHPAGVRLHDLNGQVTFKRKNTLEITVKDLMARLDQTPIELEGKLSGGGTPRLLVEGRVKTGGLDLARLGSLFHPLKELKLGGILDMDIKVHYPHGQPEKSRLKGKVKTRGFGMRLAKQDLTLSEGDAHIIFAGNSLKTRDMTMRLNEQQISVSGQVENFQEPTAQLQITSPNLNVDRLLPAAKADQTAAKPTPSKPTSTVPGKKESTGKTGTPSKKKTGKVELPPFLRKLTAQLQAEATQGKYRGEEFKDLRLKAQYERGVLKDHKFQVFMGGGRIQTQGSADLRNLKGIPFTIEPDISSVRIESIATILDTDKIATRAPLTMTGRVQGRSGSTISLLKSLDGNLEAEAGPGRIYKLGPAGNALFKVLDFINISQIFSGKKVENVRTEGVPFDSVKAQTSFLKGKMNLKQLLLESPALGLDAKGDINLVKKELNINADVEALGTLDKVLGIIPIMGKAGQKLTKMHLIVEGNLEDPKIRVRPIKGVRKAEKEEVEEGDKGAEDVIREFGKGLEQILGK